MSRPPRVSILIPCYNAQQWVRQCIQSALDQTYADIEVCVVDDGSTDGSWEIVRSFGDKVRCERGARAGANVARNQLVGMATGEWLQFLDSDDYLLPDKAEKHVGHALATPGIDLVYSPIILLNEATQEQKTLYVDPSLDPIHHFIGWGAYATHAMLMSKAAVVEVGGWKVGQPCCQEHELLSRLIMAGKKFSFCPHTGAVYRAHGPTTISTRFPGIVIAQRIAILDQLENYLLESGLMKPIYRRALCQARFDMARTIYVRDPQYASFLIDKVRENSRWFIPRGGSTPWHYRLAYLMLGFHTTEKLAALRRRMRRGLLA